MKRAWRKVVAFERQDGAALFNRQLSASWWNLELECGHAECRPVRFIYNEQTGPAKRGYTRLHHPPERGHPHHPAPRRVVCDQCERQAARERAAGHYLDP